MKLTAMELTEAPRRFARAFKLARPVSALKEWMEWRLLRPVSAFKERTESELIRYSLERRKPGTEALLSYMGALGAELILPRGDHVRRIRPDPIGKKSFARGHTNATSSSGP